LTDIKITLDWLNRLDFDDWFEDDDIRPDFVAVSDTMASLHSEESSVTTGFLRSSEVHLPSVVSPRSNELCKRNAASPKIIARGLNECYIHRPGGFTTVSKDP